VNVSRGQPPLHAAVINNHLNTVNVLLQCGVSVDQLDVDGRTAIITAAKLGLYEMCQMLILHGANVNARCVARSLTFLVEMIEINIMDY
jgi:ankyrin repeat protein